MSNFEAFLNHPIETLERALQIRKQIDQLNEVLKELFGPTSISLGAMQVSLTDTPKKRRGRPRKAQTAEPIDELSPGAVALKTKGKKRTMSPAAKAKIAAAQRARWAKSKGEKAEVAGEATPAKKQRRKISPEARARIVAAQKKRWAKAKAAKK